MAPRQRAGEAEELAALARSQGVRTVVGLQARSAPAVRYLRSVTSSVSRAAKTSATDSATSRRATNASACTEA